MKTLSVRQPWAWLIVQGSKDIENRTWATSYRGPLLIHAGLQVDQPVIDALMHDHCKKFPHTHDWPRFRTGGIVGMADLVNCVTSHDSEWFDGPYGWVLANPRPVPFYARRGKLGIWQCDYPYPWTFNQTWKHSIIYSFNHSHRASCAGSSTAGFTTQTRRNCSPTTNSRPATQRRPMRGRGLKCGRYGTIKMKLCRPCGGVD